MTIINYISELTGSGKTGLILDKIANDMQQYIIAAPNKSLCKEIFTRLTERDVLDGMHIINMDTHELPSTVLAQTLEKPKGIRIIITTHASYDLALNDGLISNIKGKWNLVIDEELSFYKTHEFNVSDVSKDILEDTISVKEYNNEFYEVVPVSHRLWNDIVVGECDDTFLTHPEYVSFVKHAHCEHYTTLIPKENYDKFLDTDTSLMKKKFKKLYTISICNEHYFNTFKSTTILSSFFEETISFKLLKWMGFNLNRMTVNHYRKVHPNSHLITLHYYCKSNWSNILKSKEIIDGKHGLTLEEHIKDKILIDLDGREFIFNANIGFRKKFNNGKLVTSIHGVNKYIDYTNMVFMPSLNATASLVNILSHFGITRKDIDFSRNVLQAYQFISRGAIRKANNGDEVNVYVMDKRTVDFLKAIYPNASTMYHDAEKFVKPSVRKKLTVPNNVRSFVSRVKSRLSNGEKIRPSTIAKYEKLIQQYY